jgi:hypothetical protein
MPMATINRAGTRVYFKSRWEYRTTETSSDIIDTYIIELPQTWYEDLSAIVIPDLGVPDIPKELTVR